MISFKPNENSTTCRKKRTRKLVATFNQSTAVEATSKMLHEQKDPRLIDPLKLLNKITTLDNEIEEFLTEADSVLSEQNALTMIELNLAEIK